MVASYLAASCCHNRDTWTKILSPAYTGTLGTYEGTTIVELAAKDLCAIEERDPACVNILHAFMNFKGFKAIQAHRAAHLFWKSDRIEVSLLIQSRCSEIWVRMQPIKL